VEKWKVFFLWLLAFEFGHSLVPHWQPQLLPSANGHLGRIVTKSAIRSDQQ